MTTDLPLIDGATAAAAVHGSFCPKLCNHACPVLAATGHQAAVPWSFHRAVADLADGRRDPAEDATAAALTLCSGCLGCQVPCTFDQDVPAQVRAGRAAVVAASPSSPETEASEAGARALVAAARDAAAATAAGRGPYGDPPDLAGLSDDVDATTVLVVGCRDDRASVAAALRLLRRGGAAVRLVAPAGCCGGVLRDLGLAEDADGGAEAVGAQLDGATTVLATDPHCLPELRRTTPGAQHVLAEVERLAQAGALTFDGAVGPVTYHDPCLLARQERLVQEPRTLLLAAGAELVEPEHHGAATACSGAGLGLDLVAPNAADAVAQRRRAELTATDATVVTACAGARTRLATEDRPVRDLLVLLADHLTGTSS